MRALAPTHTPEPVGWAAAGRLPLSGLTVTGTTGTGFIAKSIRRPSVPPGSIPPGSIPLSPEANARVLAGIIADLSEMDALLRSAGR